MIDDATADSFDLPEHCEHDHVVIYESPDPYEPPFYAVPFDHVDTWEDGTRHMEEPDGFTVTEAYREAVADRASMDIQNVKLRRDFYTVEEVDPI